MDGQTLKVSRVFGEKLIRLASSAAVCGLTLSFIFGEAVDAGPGLFRQWVPASRAIPVEYPAATPLVAFLDNLKNGVWSGAQQAENSLAAEIVTIDQIQLAEAHLPKVSEQSNEQVRNLMASVHNAAAAVVEDKVTAVAAAPVAIEKKREISGRIIVEGGKPTSGHFEVVVHNAIDGAGRPSGVPVAQQILRADDFFYKVALPDGVSSGYVFLKYFDSSADAAPTKIFSHSKNPIKEEEEQAGVLYDFSISGLGGAREAVQENEKIIAIAGKVGAMFSGVFSPVSEAVVKVRGGTPSAVTNAAGEFNVSIPEFSGEVFLEITRKDFFPTIISVSRKSIGTPIVVDIVSREVIDKMATGLGIRQSHSKSILIGRAAGSNGQAASGVSATITNKADGPFYFSAGHPVGIDSLKATSSDGRFIFFNVESGLGNLDLNINGDPVAPIVISPIEGGGVIQKKLQIVDGRVRGRVFNPIANGAGNAKRVQAIIGARLRVEGSLAWAISDSFGAFELPQFRYVLDEPIVIELTADKFYTHRFQTKASFREGTKNKYNDVNLFAFPSAYINNLASSLNLSLDPYAGVVLGGVGAGKTLRIDALADHSPVNGSKDYYFDERGALRGGGGGTHPGYGTFVIFNVPKGRTLLQGSDQSGRARYYSSVYSSPSVVSVILD